MKKFYQKIVDKGKGDCMRAALCSLLEVDPTNVPNFIELENTWIHIDNFLINHGYSYSGCLHNIRYGELFNPSERCFRNIGYNDAAVLRKGNLEDKYSIDGLFLAAVLSPKYFSLETPTQTHAVLCDKDLNTVFDPNQEYSNILRYPLADLLGYNGIVNVYLIEKLPNESTINN